jgi:hypothetical protein
LSLKICILEHENLYSDALDLYSVGFMKPLPWLTLPARRGGEGILLYGTELNAAFMSSIHTGWGLQAPSEPSPQR